MKERKLLFSLPFQLLALLLLAACATVVAPKGGPEDIAPPLIAESNPPNLSRSFKAEEIRMSFDEFVKLNNVNQRFFSSPPLNEIPEFRLRGKTMVVSWEDTLQENTTYSFHFGNSIVDITEGNAIPNFTYTFSTGPALDSLSLHGIVRDAFTKDTLKDIWILLYPEKADDSAFTKDLPVRLGKTNGRGEYKITNLPHGKFRIFALEDGDADYIYNLPTESIAFLDSLVSPHYPPQRSDTDTLILPPVVSCDMLLFNEVDSTQKLLRSSAIQVNQVRIVFKHPARNVKYELFEQNFAEGWDIPQWNKRGDTLLLWLNNLEDDTLNLLITSLKLETDTLIIPLIDVKKAQKVGKGGGVPDRFIARPNANKTKKLEWGEDFFILFGYPVTSSKFSNLLFVEGSDTIEANFAFADSVRKKLILKHNWKEETDYRIMIPQANFKDIYGLYNDTIDISFKTKKPDDYGKLKLNVLISNPKGKYKIELLTASKRVPVAYTIERSQVLEFPNLKPGIYSFRLIHDLNGNGQWDTGDYFEHLQPEPVKYYPGKIEVRAKWEIEDQWEL